MGSSSENASQGPVERLTALAGLVTSLDQRVVEAFEALARVGAASAELERLTEDTSDLIGDLRGRLDRLEARLYADLDELKTAALAKLDDIDVDGLGGRMNSLETAIQNIERAVTRVDTLVEGVVDTVPEFITRRVRARAERVESEDFPPP
jgi:chromosome segregation ATPase